MKKLLVVLLTLICIVGLVACQDANNGSTEKGETILFQEENEIIDLLSSYKVEKTNGYDYSLEQSYKGTVVNLHTIELRLNSENGTVGSRKEYVKSLNNDLSKDLYTELLTTIYYSNKKIATYEDDNWVWKDCKLSDFASVSIRSFDIDVTKVEDLDLTKSGEFSTLSFKIDEDESADFLGISTDVKDLSVVIKVNTEENQLVSFEMNYSQDLTSTKITFVPYYGNLSIDLPE